MLYAGWDSRKPESMKERQRMLLLRTAAPFFAVILAFLAGAVFIISVGHNPLVVYGTLFSFSFGRADSLGAILFNATPLIFSGLSVAVGFKTGLFNIGVEGQYLFGAFCAAWVGFSLHGLPGWLHLPLAMVAAMSGAALWILLPAWLRVYRGVHEVIGTIMLNYIAYSMLHYLVADVFMDRNQNIPAGLGSPVIRTPLFDNSVMAPKLHELLRLVGLDIPEYISVNWFFILSLMAAAGVYYLFWHTPLGFELRAVGAGAEAAGAAGIRVSRVQMKNFLLSGALAGLVGLSHLFGYYDSLDLDFPRSFGFTGIAVALLANNHPLGIIPAALLFGLLNRGAEGVQTFLAVPMEIVVIFQGILIVSVAVTMKWVDRQLRLREGSLGG